MEERELDRLTQEFLELMIQVSSRFREERRWKAGMDLSVPQMILLLILHRHGPCKAGDLARELRVTQGVVTRMVDRLLEKGLVSRSRLPDDRRMVLLSLTPQGKRLATRLERQHAQDIKGFLRSIPAQERRDLLDIFKRIKNYLESTA